MRCSGWAIAACVAGTLLAIPSASSAATRTVYAGTPPADARAFQRTLTDNNDFFPHTSTIRQGDSLRFVPSGFHNVDLPRRGGSPTLLAAPTGTAVANSTDAAGAPFWFNGQQQLGFSPVLGRVNWGKRYRYDGSKNVNSGLPLSNRPRPMTVRFDRTGTFTFWCSVHAGMKGRVRVRGRRTAVPTARSHNASVRRQVARARDIARDLPDVDPPENTFYVGVAGRNGVEKLDFAPKRMQVARGTTVNFQMSPRSYDVHTATAGPGNPERQPSSYLGTLAATFTQPVFDPRSTYPSEPPGTVASMSPALHGNGFWNSGVLDTTGRTPLPRSSRVRFDTAGSYTFWCLIHPFMRGTVDVS